MTQWVQPVIDYISQNPGMAWFIAFLVAMGEALFVIGLVVPSTAVLVAIGTLIGLGKLSFWPVFAATVLGAVVGDALSFWFGHVYKDRVKTMWPFSRYPDAIERGVAFMKIHGGKSIFIGRFVPGVKAIVPGLAGMMGMDVWHFTWINVVSGVAWAAAHLVPAVLAGAALSFLGTISTRLMIVAALAIAAALFAGYVVKWTLLYFSPAIARGRLALSQSAKRHDHPFINWFGRTFDPQHLNPVTMLSAAILLTVGLPTFFFILGEVGAKEPLALADHAISNLLQSLRTGPANAVLTIVTMMADGVVLIPVIVTVIAWLLYKRDWRHAVGFLIATVSTSLFVSLVKYLMQRQRPTALYEGLSSLSFPSGHATNNAVVYAILAYMIAHALPRWAQAIVYFSFTIFIFVIAFSRVYLGAHWPSDVMAGLFFGFAMAAAFALLLGNVEKRAGGLKLAGVALAALLAFGGYHVSSNWQAGQAMYASKRVFTKLSAADWLGGGWKELPTSRFDLVGQMEEPFVLQVAGDVPSIVAQLVRQGWSDLGAFKTTKLAAFGNVATSIAGIPVLPTLHDGYMPAITLSKVIAGRADSRVVLRLWQSDIQIEDGAAAMQVYLGSIVQEQLKSPVRAFSVVDAVDGYVPRSEDLPAVAQNQQSFSRQVTIDGKTEQAPLIIAIVPKR